MPFVPHSETSIRDISRVLCRHRRKAIGFFLAVMTAVTMLTILSPETYRSEGKLFVRLGRENVGLDPTATLGQGPVVAVPQFREDEINSVVEILRSRMLVEKVVDAIGPTAILGQGQTDGGDGFVEHASPFHSQSPRNQAIVKLDRNLGIEAVKKTNILVVSHEGPDPRVSQQIVDTLIDLFLKEHVRINRTPGAHEFLVEQTAQLRERLTGAEQDLRDLKNETGIASAGEQRKLLVARTGQLEDELFKTEAALAAQTAEARGLRESLSGLARMNVLGRTTGLPNQASDNVRQELYRLQLKENELLSKYTEHHFEVQQIQRQIAAAQEKLGTKDFGSDDKPALVEGEPALASLHQKAETLRGQLEQLRGQLKRLNENSLRVESLQRDIELHDANYRRYAEHLEQARIDQSLESQRISNISIVQPATHSVKPIRPKKLLNLSLGLVVAVFGGVCLAFAAEYLDHSFRTPEEIERTLDLPTLASIPRMERSQLAYCARN